MKGLNGMKGLTGMTGLAGVAAQPPRRHDSRASLPQPAYAG